MGVLIFVFFVFCFCLFFYITWSLFYVCYLLHLLLFVRFGGVERRKIWDRGVFVFCFCLIIVERLFGSVWNDRKAAERIFMNIYSCHEVGWVERIWNMGHDHVAMDFCL
jgi:hypothetical protein